MAKQTDLTPVYAAANAAVRIYNSSFRRGNILRAQMKLKQRTLTKRLVDFYLDDIDREVNLMFWETDSAA